MVDNFRPGYLQRGSPLGAVRKQVMLIADDTQIDCSGIGYLELSSDSATAANRTFTIVGSTLVGQELEIVFHSGSSTSAQLADSGTCKLSAVWEPLQYDSLTLFWEGSYWIEKARSAASGIPDLALTDGHVFVGNSSGLAADVAMSGDVTIDDTGATTIGASKVLTANIAAANVTLAKLASGITPSHVVKYAANVTTVGGAASEAFTVAGVAATDLVFCQMKTQGTGSRTILSVTPTTNTITIVFSGDPSNNHVVSYQVLRAAS